MGQLTIRELMAVIAAAQVVVSGATGPAHLAAALNVPTVSLFDPRRNNLPTRWKPLGRGVLLRPDVPTCEKCIGEACPYWDCLDRFTVENVAARLGAVVQSAQPLTIHHI
jgi:heptosyltransferase-2